MIVEILPAGSDLDLLAETDVVCELSPLISDSDQNVRSMVESTGLSSDSPP